MSWSASRVDRPLSPTSRPVASTTAVARTCPVAALQVAGCPEINELVADKNAKLTAMGDAFQDRLELSRNVLEKMPDVTPKLDVPRERQFVGFDAYKQVLATDVDVVLLTTPPHFRPIQLKAAVEAGISVTDDSAAMELAGFQPQLVHGDPGNFEVFGT